MGDERCPNIIHQIWVTMLITGRAEARRRELLALSGRFGVSARSDTTVEARESSPRVITNYSSEL